MRSRLQSVDTIDKIRKFRGIAVIVTNIFINESNVYNSKRDAGFALGVSDTNVNRHIK